MTTYPQRQQPPYATPPSLFFLRHGKLLLPYKDHSEMPLAVLADLASFRLNPPVDTEFVTEQFPRLLRDIPLHTIRTIYVSPVRRCQETANCISRLIADRYGKYVQPVIAPELKEVQFDLMRLYPQGSTPDLGSMNTAVFKAMTSPDAGCESAEAAYGRVGGFLKRHTAEEGSIFVAHDFLMRLIEIYIRQRGDLGHEITYEELESTGRNLYLHGFATGASLGDITPL